MTTKELTGDEVRVSASYSRKVQLKQYEPLDVSCSLTEVCGPKDVEKTYDRLFLTCKNFVDEKILMELPQTLFESKLSNKEKAEKGKLDFRPEEIIDDEDESGITITT